METQNITLSLPKDILLKVKHIAVRHNVSVSNLWSEDLNPAQVYEQLSIVNPFARNAG
jgi:predicted nucleic acid-binding protein